MTKYKHIFDKAAESVKRAGRALWNVLSFSLADPVFSFAKAVCVSLEADGVYLVYAEKTPWRMNVRFFRHYPLPENHQLTPEYVAASVAGFVRDFKITNATFILGVPQSWAIIQAVDFPSAAKENLARVVAFELDRLTPLNRDNACYDYAVLDENAQRLKILLAVVRADKLNDYLQALKAKNIEIKKVGLSVFMIRHLLKATYPNTNMVVLSVKEDGSYEGGVALNDSVPRSFTGRMTISEPESFEPLAKQVQDAVDTLVKKSSPPRIVVNGDEANYTILRDQFKTVNVSHLNKDIKLPVPRNNRELSASATGGLMEMFGRRAKDINLMSGYNQDNVRTPLLATILLLIAMASVAVFWFAAPVYYEQQRLDVMSQRIHAMKPEVKKVESLKEEIEKIEADIAAIYDFKKQNDLTMNIIRDMTNALPAKTWLTRLRITSTNAEIEGFSASATEILLKLENSKHFKKVEFASPTFRDPRLNTERFVIKMELKNAAGKKEQKKEMKNEKK